MHGARFTMSNLEILESVRACKTAVLKAYEQLEEVKTAAEAPQSPVPRFTPKGGQIYDIANNVALIDRMTRKWAKAASKYLTAWEAAARLIDSADLTADQKLILRYRYILCRKWDQIAGTLGYTREWLHAKHRDALRRLS